MSLETALQYAGRGWPIFPVTSSKKPFKGSRGLKDATTDPKEITELWRGRERAWVALATGWDRAVATGKILVADADGAAGLAKLGEMAAACGGRLPPTLRASTPRGGLHVFYLVPDGVKLRSRNQKRANSGDPGLDIKARGGYVVLPEGDGTDGRQWISQEPIAYLTAPMVRWLEEFIGAQADREVAGSGLPWGDDGGNSNPLPTYVTTSQSRSSIGENTATLAQRALAGQGRSVWTEYEEARIRSALASLPADGYDLWVEIGMILQGLDWDRSDGTSKGLDIWLDWSETCPDKFSEVACEAKWASFGKRGGIGVGLGTLFTRARDAGWSGAVTGSDLGSSTQEKGFNQSEVNGYVNGVNGTTYALPAALAAPSVGVPIFADYTEKGRPRATSANARAALRMLGLKCQYDTFHEKLIVGGRVLEQWAGEVTDNAVYVLKNMMHAQFGFEPSKETAYEAVIQECLAGSFHPIRDYIDGLTWDGVPRIGAWLSAYMGTPDAPLAREIGRLALVAAVRRVEDPGCKFDQIIVFEGGEGTGKSTALQILAGIENHSDQEILTLNDRAQQEQLQGVWLYEIGELAGLHRADIERVKMFASRTHDRARPAYGRVRENKPRQCVMFGTTNDSQYLRSQTGNRRFWPVITGTIDLVGLRRDRDQLWAEAADVEALGAPLTLDARLWGDATSAQDARMVDDPWLDILATVAPTETYPTSDGLANLEWRVSSRDLLEITLGIEPHQQTDANAKRLAACMKRLGWSGPGVKWIGSKAQKAYTKPASR